MKNLINLLADDLSTSESDGKTFIQMAHEYFNESSNQLKKNSPYVQDLECLCALFVRIHEMKMIVENVEPNESDKELMVTYGANEVLTAMTLLEMVHNMMIKDHMLAVEMEYGDELLERALSRLDEAE